MSFFQKLLHYLVNEVLVQGLANNRTFQRFAVKTDATLKEITKKGSQHTGQLTDQASQVSEQASSFLKTFRDELTKGLTDQAKRNGGSGGKPA